MSYKNTAIPSFQVEGRAGGRVGGGVNMFVDDQTIQTLTEQSSGVWGKRGAGNR